MSNKAMYILVNEDIKIGKGKLAGQVGHAVASWIYRYCVKTADFEPFDENVDLFDEYMKGIQRKIILKCPQSKLEELEKENQYIVIRDAGLTQLEPNTLTCINIGIYDRDLDEVPTWVKELKLYNN